MPAKKAAKVAKVVAKKVEKTKSVSVSKSASKSATKTVAKNETKVTQVVKVDVKPAKSLPKDLKSSKASQSKGKKDVSPPKPVAGTKQRKRDLSPAKNIATQPVKVDPPVVDSKKPESGIKKTESK